VHFERRRPVLVLFWGVKVAFSSDKGMEIRLAEDQIRLDGYPHLFEVVGVLFDTSQFQIPSSLLCFVLLFSFVRQVHSLFFTPISIAS